MAQWDRLDWSPLHPASFHWPADRATERLRRSIELEVAEGVTARIILEFTQRFRFHIAEVHPSHHAPATIRIGADSELMRGSLVGRWCPSTFFEDRSRCSGLRVREQRKCCRCKGNK